MDKTYIKEKCDNCVNNGTRVCRRTKNAETCIYYVKKEGK
jgi:hypothetical protein